MVVDIPIAVALGFDEPVRGLMRRPPRPVGSAVLNRGNWIRLCSQGAVMTAGALIAYEVGNDRNGAVLAATMLLTTLSLYHLIAGLLARDQRGTIFDRALLPGPTQMRRYGFALVAIIAVTTIGFLQRIADTTEMSFTEWSICVGLSLALLVFDEAFKFVVRHRETAGKTQRVGSPVRAAAPAV